MQRAPRATTRTPPPADSQHRTATSPTARVHASSPTAATSAARASAMMLRPTAAAVSTLQHYLLRCGKVTTVCVNRGCLERPCACQYHDGTACACIDCSLKLLRAPAVPCVQTSVAPSAAMPQTGATRRRPTTKTHAVQSQVRGQPSCPAALCRACRPSLVQC